MNSNEKRAAIILAALFLLLGFALLCVVYYLNNRVRFLNAQITTLNEQNSRLKRNTADRISERNILSDEIYGFEREEYNYNLAPEYDATETYAIIFRKALDNSVTVLSSGNVTTEGGNKNIISININLRGEYSDMINLLADWRALPFPLKISEFEIKNIDNGQTETNVIIQALIKE